VAVVHAAPWGDNIIYDSFGRENKEIMVDVRKHDFLQTDPDAEQGLLETNCGARSLAWIICFDMFGKNMAMKI
jgi:hypothetical protein